MKRSSSRSSKSTTKTADKVETKASKVIDTMLTDEKSAKEEAEEKKEQKVLDETNEIVEEAEKKGIVKKVEAKESEQAPKSIQKETTAASEETIVSFEVQYGDRNIKAEDVVEAAKKDWVEKTNGDCSLIKTLDIYYKPEENHVYYVIDGENKGDFEL